MASPRSDAKFEKVILARDETHQVIQTKLQSRLQSLDGRISALTTAVQGLAAAVRDNNKKEEGACVVDLNENRIDQDRSRWEKDHKTQVRPRTVDETLEFVQQILRKVKQLSAVKGSNQTRRDEPSSPDELSHQTLQLIAEKQNLVEKSMVLTTKRKAPQKYTIRRDATRQNTIDIGGGAARTEKAELRLYKNHIAGKLKSPGLSGKDSHGWESQPERSVQIYVDTYSLRWIAALSWLPIRRYEPWVEDITMGYLVIRAQSVNWKELGSSWPIYKPVRYRVWAPIIPGVQKSKIHSRFFCFMVYDHTSQEGERAIKGKSHLIGRGDTSHTIITGGRMKQYSGKQEQLEEFAAAEVKAGKAKKGETLLLKNSIDGKYVRRGGAGFNTVGFQMKIGSNSLFGTHARVIKEDSSRKLGAYVSMLQHSADECQGNGINIEVKIAVGAPVEKVVLQEVAASNATWVVLDWHLRKELRYYLKRVPCKVALVLENLTLDVMRPYYSDSANGVPKHELVYSLSKPVLVTPTEDIENNERSVISAAGPEIMDSMENTEIQKSILVTLLSCNSKEPDFSSQEEFSSNSPKEKLGVDAEMKIEYYDSPPVMLEQLSLLSYSDAPFLCDDKKMENFQNSMDCVDIEIEIATVECSSENAMKGSNTELLIKYTESATVLSASSGLEMELGSMRYSYSEINIATDNFSPDNLLDEEGYGVVFKGQLENGQLIRAKVQKEANTQGIPEFLRFACHKNIEMFLGYYCNEDFKILVYEFVCNKSLEWHLLGNTESVLDWHRRHSISIGIAKGLRFLHEECRGSPIIHGYLRPCNVLLTHDFDPLLGNCGLKNLITCKDNKLTTTHTTSTTYLAPEFAENGTFSIKTDVYAFGIVLIQLISGQRFETAELSRSNNNQSLVQWALPLIQMLALDELVDPQLGDSYSIYELYNMASTACLCIQTNPDKRPSMGQVLHLLEGKSAHLEHLTGQMQQDIAYEQTTCRLTTCGCG